MLHTRIVPVMVIGALMMTSAVAATSTTARASSILTTEQIAAIHKECAKENGDSMTSKAYETCVKTKEDEAIAKANEKN